MIRSMTAFGHARAESPKGSVAVEIRTVNSRFLDVNFRIADDLRSLESPIREKLGQYVTRGKADIRIHYARAHDDGRAAPDETHLQKIAAQLAFARRHIPDIPAPRLHELFIDADSASSLLDDFGALCMQAVDQALAELQAAREREGRRLSDIMLDNAAQIDGVLAEVERDLPALLDEQQEKITARLREALSNACPDGYAQIGGAELSARIAQEASLFSLRIDVAEELGRLKSHLSELRHLLSTGKSNATAVAKRQTGVGKRLDFLFQEMNREANTLGSKAAGLSVTRTAIDLKLLIEQMREQAANLE
ncbi:MAG: YicC/YloC family endoribonuclease [Candidimonas sp.]